MVPAPTEAYNMISNTLHFFHTIVTTLRIASPRLLFVVMIIGGTTGIVQAQEPPKWQADSVLKPVINADTQVDKWREVEIRRFVSGRQNNVMDGKTTSYQNLVVYPLLLYILCLSAVRLRQF